MVEALEPCKKSLETLDLEFGFDHEGDRSFRSLPSMKTFTSLKTLCLTQGAIGNHTRVDDVSRDAFTKLLTSSIEELQITMFHDAYGYAVLDFAEQTAAGAYPNLLHVRLAGWDYGVSEPGEFVSGQAFLKFARGQDEAGLDNLPHQQDWVLLGRRCLNDKDFRSEVVCDVHEDSRVRLVAAFRNLRLRKRIQRLFSNKCVMFECVAVEVKFLGGAIHVAYF